MRSSVLSIVSLGEKDLCDVYQLYQTVRQSTLFGFLADRSFQDFADVLGDEETVVAVGARDGQRLVGYTLCRRSFDNPCPDVRSLQSIDAGASILYCGMGTVVDPAYEGRFLTQRLFAVRQQMLMQRGVHHMIGLVDIGNVASIANILRAGACLAGFARDETSLNYVAYGGVLHRRCEGAEPVASVDLEHHEAQQARFDAGLVVTHLQRCSTFRRLLGFQDRAVST